MGGDDFIEKPFNLSLTIAKIQALLRRTYDLTVSNNEITVKGVSSLLMKPHYITTMTLYNFRLLNYKF